MTYSYHGKTFSGVAAGGITGKGVDPPQPGLLGEAGGAGATHVGV